MMSNEVRKLMETLDITQQEAIELLEFDKGDVENEEVEQLTEKAKKVETPVKRGRKPKTDVEKTGMAGVTQQTRKKKENPTKKSIIAALSKVVAELEDVSEIDIKNPEKTIYFKIGEETFEIDLKMKRKPKN